MTLALAIRRESVNRGLRFRRSHPAWRPNRGGDVDALADVSAERSRMWILPCDTGSVSQCALRRPGHPRRQR